MSVERFLCMSLNAFAYVNFVLVCCELTMLMCIVFVCPVRMKDDGNKIITMRVCMVISMGFAYLLFEFD